MARPRKEGMEYFPHDTDATDDEKIDAMRALFGNNGYAFYFILCERIYRSNNAELDVSKPVLMTPIVKKLLLNQQQFDEMLDAALELNLFSRTDFEDRSVITSNGIKKRFEQVSQMRDRWRKRKENSAEKEVIPVENGGDNPPENAEETGESKAKQSKVKESNNIYNNNYNKGGNNPYKIFESNEFGKLNETTAQLIAELEAEYSTDWVCRAMRVAIKKGGDKKNLGYVEGILKSWKSLNHPEPWTIDKQPEKLPPNVTHINRNRYGNSQPKQKPLMEMVDPGPAKRLSDEERAELRRKLVEMDANKNRDVVP